MKKVLILMLSVSTLIVASCKKGSNENPEPETPKNEVTINGSIYSTVKIGNQT